MSGWMDGYQPVEDRLREFYERHPYGRINTELLGHHNGEYIVKATVWIGDEVGSTPPKATGLAHESVETLVPTMKASALEVCETSAIGRALANMGLAPKGARPSREEMQKSGGVAPDQSEGDKGAAPSRGEEAVVPASPSDANPFARVVEVTGSRAKAREAINRVCDLEYTAKTVVDCTDEEADVTIAALAEAALGGTA